ncbi:MAG: hypothetical protein ACRBF0_13000 [Calditrichia bacterium]
MKIKWVLYLTCAALFFSACNPEDIINDVVEGIELTDDQENAVVITQIASEQGGAVAQLQALMAMTRADFYQKSTLDTTFSIEWVSYTVSASFYRENGQEIPVPVPGLLDSMSVSSALSGDSTITTNGQSWSISLNRTSNFQMNEILQPTAIVNGTGTDRSQHGFSTPSLDLQLALNSTFGLTNIGLSQSATNNIPVSGVLAGNAKGTVTAGNLPSKEIDIPYSVTFTGSQQAVVSINNGERTITIDLITGSVL